MPPISNKITLEKSLQRMYWIETEMEQLATWEARIELMDNGIAALETLSHDSDRHGDIVKKWLIKANIEIPEKAPAGLPQHVFEFDGLASPEMFKTIMKYEILAKNVYMDMRNTEPSVIRELFPNENDANDFLSDLDQLVEDEQRHADICKKQIAGFSTIILDG